MIKEKERFFSELDKIRDYTYNDPKDELISKLKKEIRQLKIELLLKGNI